MSNELWTVYFRAVSENTEDNLNANITHVVQILMALNGMNQQQLAATMGHDKSVITRLFKGERAWKIEDLVRVGEIFDRPTDYFFEQPGSLVRSGITGGYPTELVAA